MTKKKSQETEEQTISQEDVGTISAADLAAPTEADVQAAVEAASAGEVQDVTRTAPEPGHVEAELRDKRIDAARDQGRQAFAAGQTRDTNPFEMHGPIGMAWREGWDSAEAEKRGVA